MADLSTPKISICIPTYNRSGPLSELLDSIIAQGLEDEIEVVVSDDASPDDTARVAMDYSARIKNYLFICQRENLGFDAHLLAIAAAAKGDYIWFMGDDDRIEPGGLARVLEALKQWPDVSGLTVGVIDYDVTMTHPTGVRTMPPTQIMSDSAALFTECGDLLGFISALVINRSKWNAIASDPDLEVFHNLYIQVYIVGRVLDRFGKWGVVQEPCTGFRSGNDQFLSKVGWLDRLKIDVTAYDQIAHALFADRPAVRESFRRRIFDTHVIARLNNLKTADERPTSVSAAIRYLYGPYKAMPRYWMRAVPTLIAPRWVMRRAKSLYRRLSPRSGAARARQLRS